MAKNLGVVTGQEFIITPTDSFREWCENNRIAKARFGRYVPVWQGKQVEWFGMAYLKMVWIRVPGEKEKRKVLKKEVSWMTPENFAALQRRICEIPNP